MQIETIGKYQLHLIAHELPGKGWDPFMSILRFDDEMQDFRCVLEKRRAGDHPYATYEEAIEAGRLAGTSLIQRGDL